MTLTKPVWLKQNIQVTPSGRKVRRLLSELGLNTVCLEAGCPNRNSCYADGTATFLILGRTCTRDCRFCNIGGGIPKPVEGEEGKEGEQVQEAEPEVPSIRPVKVKGYTFTLNALAATMIRMMRSDYFDEVELVDSKDTLYAGEKAYLFELAANVHYLSEEELRNLIGQAESEAESNTSHASLN